MIHVGINVKDAALDHERVVIDIYRDGLFQSNDERPQTAFRSLDAFGRDLRVSRRDDLLGKVEEVGA